MLNIGDKFCVTIYHPEYNIHKNIVYTVKNNSCRNDFSYQNEFGELFLENEVEPAY
jgi:hypothetical protein